MKKIVIQLYMVLCFTLFSSVAQSVSIYSPSLTIEPAPVITTLDIISAELSGDFATTGFVIDGSPSVTISGNTINIGFNALSPDGIVLFVLTPFSVAAEIGALSAGDYNINAGFYVDGMLEHALSDSFTVSAVPLPASIWLFVSGFAGLFSLLRK